MYRQSTILASTAAPFVADQKHLQIQLQPDSTIDLADILHRIHAAHFDPGQNISLHFDHMHSEQPFPVMDIYLDITGRASVEENNRVGALSVFGIADSSGKHRVFDVSRLLWQLTRHTGLQVQHLAVLLVPFQPLTAADRLEIGRVRLVYHQS